MKGPIKLGGWVHVGPAFRLTRVPAHRRAPRKQQSRSGPVTVITVHADVWEAALRVAEGDPLRIQIIDPTTVIVHNRRTTRRTA